MKNKPTILLVDDDEDDLMLLGEAINKINPSFELVELKNGKIALDYLQTTASNDLPDLIVLDINMPVLSGKETLAMLKADESLQQIPVVMYTTSFSEADRRYAAGYGTDMITEPMDMNSLNEIARTLLNYCSSCS